MLSEKDKYKLIKEVINKFSNFNYNVRYYFEELDVIFKSEDFISKKKAFKNTRYFYCVLSMIMASFTIFIVSSIPQLVKSRFKMYETTIYTYVNGELIDEPQVGFSKDLEREQTIYLDIVPVSEFDEENAYIYRYDVSNISVKNINDYNNLYFDETSDEFVEKVAFNKNIKDKSVPYIETTIITQNRNKYILDEESYDDYKSSFLRPFISSFVPLLLYYLGTDLYKDTKKKYNKELDEIYKKYIDPYMDYKDYYRIMYEKLRKDVEDKEDLALFDYYFSSLYEEAGRIEESAKKSNKLLRK